MNYVICPPLYAGSSFVDIYWGIKTAMSVLNVEVIFVNNDIKENKLSQQLDSEIYLQIQLDTLAKMGDVENDSRLLFLDFFNPGLDALKYHFEIKGHKIKIGSLMHGLSFLPGDLYQWDWLQSYELAWLKTYNCVYVPTGFDINYIPFDYRRAITTAPWGLDGQSFPKPSALKSFDVVFPHRIAEDKGFEDFFTIATSLPEISFLITCPQDIKHFPSKIADRLSSLNNVSIRFGENEEDHLLTLSQCKIVLSCAKQENFGFAVLKAVKCGAIPVLPNRLCYPQMYRPDCLYNSLNEVLTKIKYFISKVSNGQNFLLQQEFSFKPLITDFFC